MQNRLDRFERLMTLSASCAARIPRSSLSRRCSRRPGSANVVASSICFSVKGLAMLTTRDLGPPTRSRGTPSTGSRPNFGLGERVSGKPEHQERERSCLPRCSSGDGPRPGVNGFYLTYSSNWANPALAAESVKPAVIPLDIIACSRFGSTTRATHSAPPADRRSAADDLEHVGGRGLL